METGSWVTRTVSLDCNVNQRMQPILKHFQELILTKLIQETTSDAIRNYERVIMANQ